MYSYVMCAVSFQVDAKTVTIHWDEISTDFNGIPVLD